MYSFVYVLGHAHKSRNLQRPDKALNPLELEVQVTASHPHSWWEPNAGSLQEQHTLLSTEPSLQFHAHFLIRVHLTYSKGGEGRIVFLGFGRWLTSQECLLYGLGMHTQKLAMVHMSITQHWVGWAVGIRKWMLGTWNSELWVQWESCQRKKVYTEKRTLIFSSGLCTHRTHTVFFIWKS